MDGADLRPVRLRITDPSLREDLGAHYARAGFAVRPNGPDELEVERVDAPDRAQARREVEVHLLMWDLLHPESPAKILD
jgi:hypothetical protein